MRLGKISSATNRNPMRKDSSPPFFSSPLLETLTPSSCTRLSRRSASAGSIPRLASRPRGIPRLAMRPVRDRGAGGRQDALLLGERLPKPAGAIHHDDPLAFDPAHGEQRRDEHHSAHQEREDQGHDDERFLADDLQVLALEDRPCLAHDAASPTAAWPPLSAPAPAPRVR